MTNTLAYYYRVTIIPVTRFVQDPAECHYGFMANVVILNVAAPSKRTEKISFETNNQKSSRNKIFSLLF
jgi:hypothetical protein